MSIITIKNLKYRYPSTKVNALNNVNLEINKGEFIGIIGKNGAGKSTLAQAITGIIPNLYKGLYAGEVTVCGMKVTETEMDALVKKVGLIFQNPFNQMTGVKDTVYEEIAFGLENFGIPPEEMKAKIDKSLNLLGMTEYKNRNLFDLSGGQMQRVAIASVITMEPEIIILDEPTSQLDPQGSDDVFRAIKTLSEKGVTIIFVTHKLEKIAQYSDKIILLEDGELMAIDTPEKIFSRNKLENIPLYTKIGKRLNVKTKEYYPITLEQAKECCYEYFRH